MADTSKEARDRAQARFEKTQKAQREGAKAMAAYEAEGLAMREKTARLKALRLAREAEEATVAAATPAGPKRAAAKKAPKAAKSAAKSKESLSGWLNAERGSGRRG
jgi:hypothetical protein